MPDSEHANFERIEFHARAYYGRGARPPMCKSAAIIEKFSAAAHRAGDARGSLVSPELERTGREAYLEQERAERGGETDHREHEEDGYDSRQVDGDERAREKRHHHQRYEQCGYRTECDRDVYVMCAAREHA
jgi:hypothetical protein